MKNYLVVDFDPKKSGQTASFRPLLDSLKDNSGQEWEYSGPGIKNRALHSAERYIMYFFHAWRLFRNRKNISGIVSLQQFYGIVFAGYCMLFRVKKTTRNAIVSFIYKPKNGLIGKLYGALVRRIILSDYVDKLYVHTKNEVEHYVRQLDCSCVGYKFQYLPLGIVDIGKKEKQGNKGYVLSVGNSNRDFKFVEDALVNLDFDVRIYSDEYPSHINNNVICCKSVPGSEYVELLSNCFCMVIALDDENISSGQLVILQTYAMGKPLIITQTKGCAEYVISPPAITISKSKEELVDAINQLRRDSNYYEELCKQSRSIFNTRFSFVNMGKNIGHYFEDESKV